MRTYNVLYSTNSKLKDFVEDIGADNEQNVLVRIHTAIHNKNTILDLINYIKEIIPNCKICGSSTSAVIMNGDVIPNKCLISISMFDSSTIQTAAVPVLSNYKCIDPGILAARFKAELPASNIKLMFCFLNSCYTEAIGLISKCNDYFPHVPMIGGIANTSDDVLNNYDKPNFVFNEERVLTDGVALAAISSGELEVEASFATGVETIDDELIITKSFGMNILEFDGEDATKTYVETIGSDVLHDDPGLSGLFPFVYSSNEKIPFVVAYYPDTTLYELYDASNPCNECFYDEARQKHYTIDFSERKDFMKCKNVVKDGERIKKAFIYNDRIIKENRDNLYRIRHFKKAETMFSYVCALRNTIYSSCTKWELSPYDDTNVSGCIIAGEILYSEGKNYFGNMTTTVAVAGEAEGDVILNEYALTDSGDAFRDTNYLIRYLLNSERYFSESKKKNSSSKVAKVREALESKVLYDKRLNLPNYSKFLYDAELNKPKLILAIAFKNYNVFKSFLSKDDLKAMNATYTAIFSKYTAENNYHPYTGNDKYLFLATSNEDEEEFIKKAKAFHEKNQDSVYGGYNPIFEFCILKNVEPGKYDESAEKAFISMKNANSLFYIYDCSKPEKDDYSNHIKMVKIINDAIKNGKVIPYYQGIHNNKTNEIDLYEALMRIADEDGKIYYPDTFLPVARKMGILYDKLSYAMIKKVLRTFKYTDNIKVSMNLSISDIKNNKIVTFIFNFLKSAPHPENYIFELVENEDIDNYDYVAEFISQIHKCNASVALDDFGSGYSNLMHVINLKFDYLKIDGSLVKESSGNPNCVKMIKLVSMWKQFSDNEMKVIAEYVENEKIQKLIEDNSIDYSQGYYFAKPERIFDNSSNK